jgi:hypothetical protein
MHLLSLPQRLVRAGGTLSQATLHMQSMLVGMQRRPRAAGFGVVDTVRRRAAPFMGLPGESRSNPRSTPECGIIEAAILPNPNDQ